MITIGVKTTPVLAMQLLCDLQSFTNIIEKNAAILFNRLIRLPNNSFWRDYDSDGGRNLKTQKGFIQCVRENIQYKVINDVPFELLSFANPLDHAILDIRLDLVLNVRKRDLSPTALHAIALETINTRFPLEEWLHIYTDGSLLDFAQGAGIGVFSHLFFYLHAGPLTTHFDGEVEAIHIALQQLAARLPPIERAVILSDSTSALQALSNYNNFRRDLTLHSAKLKIKRIFRESFRLTASRVARDKPWSTLCKKSHGIPSSPRAAAVAKFRLLTGHDCLCAHLFRFNLVTSPICVLCDTGQDMTAAHLDECSALNDLNCIYATALHWCAKTRDEVEKLAYQLNEEAERTERPIRRLSKVMYGSTCAHMPVDVMEECLSSIKHAVGATGRPISRFTVARRLHGGGLFARRPVRCVPLTPAHRIRRSLWYREHRNWRDNEWGRVLFTDESRFSLSSDFHRILIWRERGSRNHPSNFIERDRYGGRGVLVWGGIMLGRRTDLHIFDAGSVNGTRYCNQILLPYVRLFRGAMGLRFLFMDDNAPCHRTVAAEQLLESRRLATLTLPPVTIWELRLTLQDEWAAMLQKLIDTLILSMGRRCETCLAVRGDHIPY
ncbi:transposable element Tcb2 transposase [Trichonephila clavipes]|nr:transposable element Tcb2 transposase [Trichonephila clavipes]